MEGPSLTILKEELAPFVGKKVLSSTGNTKQPKEALVGRKLSSVDTWGKALFLTFSSSKKSDTPIVTKTHFLMFGSYRINEPREGRVPRLELEFKNGRIYFYACSIKFDSADLLEALDRKVDLMSPQWSEKHVLKLIEKKKLDTLLCDLFLDQTVFAGSGNIVKNEVLFNLRLHPMTKLKQVPRKDWPKLARGVHDYMWKFYEWKKKFELRRHWQVFRKGSCPLCGEKVVREKLGKFERRTFYCKEHQPFPTSRKAIKLFAVLPPKEKPKKEARVDH